MKKKPLTCQLRYGKNGKLFCQRHKQALMYIYQDSEGSIRVHCQVFEDQNEAYYQAKLKERIGEVEVK